MLEAGLVVNANLHHGYLSLQKENAEPVNWPNYNTHRFRLESLKDKVGAQKLIRLLSAMCNLKTSEERETNLGFQVTLLEMEPTDQAET